MSKTVIKIENLSKIYRLGEVGTGTVSHDLNRWWANIRGKEDPFTLVGQINDRSKKAESDYVYALKDINIEVKQGEILGIIGKNGAGKSTLLKILSRITKPSTGQIKVKGRIAALLEVGTGMNPEMTGRENIYLNGTIMGMTRAEITRKFDEIIDFAGCAMYVDTPVKRYSSGMRVRLGFAVAAFLEPEILVVDEVLAVGDAEFQKKAIGKMKDVSANEGRTVLFVSHNMVSIQALCTKGLLLNNGQSIFTGNISESIDNYLQSNIFKKTRILDSLIVKNPDLEIEDITINNKNTPYLNIFNGHNSFELCIKGKLKVKSNLTVELNIYDKSDNLVAFYGPGIETGEILSYKKGNFCITERIIFPKRMAAGDYYLSIHLTNPFIQYHFIAEKAIHLKYEGIPFLRGNNKYETRGYYILEKGN